MTRGGQWVNRRIPGSGFSFFLLCFLVFLSPVEANHTVTDGLGRTVEVPERPQRIATGGLSITATVAELVSSDRLAVVDSYAGDTRYSHVADTVSGVPTLRQVQPEAILSHDPDLIFLTPFTPAPIRQRILELDIPVIVTHETSTLHDINRNIQLIGSSLHRAQSAQELQLPASRDVSDTPSGPRMMFYLESGVLPGSKTLPSSIMKRAGFQNVLEEVDLEGWKSVPAEMLVSLDPEWIVLDRLKADAVREVLTNDPVLSQLSAVRNDQILELWPKYLTVSGPHIRNAIQYWNTNLRGETEFR